MAQEGVVPASVGSVGTLLGVRHQVLLKRLLGLEGLGAAVVDEVLPGGAGLPLVLAVQLLNLLLNLPGAPAETSHVCVRAIAMVVALVDA